MNIYHRKAGTPGTAGTIRRKAMETLILFRPHFQKMREGSGDTSGDKPWQKHCVPTHVPTDAAKCGQSSPCATRVVSGVPGVPSKKDIGGSYECFMPLPLTSKGGVDGLEGTARRYTTARA